MSARVRYAVFEDRFAMVRMGMEFLAASGLPLPVDPVHMEATAKAHMAGGDKVAFILDVDGGKHGMLLALVAPSPIAPVRIADEVVFWTDPDHRGHGRELLDAYEQWAAGRGADVIAMHAPNDRVGKLYARRGYERADATYYRMEAR